MLRNFLGGERVEERLCFISTALLRLVLATSLVSLLRLPCETPLHSSPVVSLAAWNPRSDALVARLS